MKFVINFTFDDEDSLNYLLTKFPEKADKILNEIAMCTNNDKLLRKRMEKNPDYFLEFAYDLIHSTTIINHNTPMSRRFCDDLYVHDVLLNRFHEQIDPSKVLSFIGYKALDENLHSIFDRFNRGGMTFEVGKMYFEYGPIIPYKNGFSFYLHPKYCLYDTSPKIRFLKVQGFIYSYKNDKITCKFMKVLEEISLEEMKRLSKIHDIQDAQNPNKLVQIHVNSGSL